MISVTRNSESRSFNRAGFIVIRLATTLTLMLVFGGICKADSILELHSIEQQTKNTYSLNGPDPYLVFKLDASEQVRKNHKNANHIRLNISLIEPTAVDELTVELFFKPLQIDHRKVNNPRLFDPLYRLKVIVPSLALNAERSKLAIALPKDIELKADQEIRVDIDGCQKCVLQINTGPTLVSQANTSTLNENQVIAYRVHNGAKPISETGISLGTQGWRLNQIVNVDNSFKVDGNDPYLVSDYLDIDTKELGGVLFSLNFQNSRDEPRDYQLFYATDKHGFVENATSATRVADTEQGISRFVIPLNFLSQPPTNARILERIRLDLLPLKDEFETWSFIEASLLSKTQMIEYSNLIPTRIIHNKHQRAQGLVLIKNIAKKVLSDPWFVLFYFLLILLTVVGFWRQFKR